MSGLVLYTVYCHPRDYPGEYVVRRSVVGPDLVETDPVLTGRGFSLEEVRAMIPHGLVRLPPDVSDDPVIEEVWL
jgi:hypothetical protein